VILEGRFDLLILEVVFSFGVNYCTDKMAVGLTLWSTTMAIL